MRILSRSTTVLLLAAFSPFLVSAALFRQQGGPKLMPDQELEAHEVEQHLAAAKARDILDNRCDKYFRETFQSMVDNSECHSYWRKRNALSFMARMKCHCDLGPADKEWFSKWLMKEATPLVLQQFKTPEVVDPSAATQQKGPALEVGQAQGVDEGRALVLPSSSSSSLPRAGGRKEDIGDEPVVVAAGPPRLGVLHEAWTASSVRASVGNEQRGEVSVQVALGRIKQATADASARRRNKNGISDEDELENEAAAVLELSPQLQALKAEISQHSSGAGSQALAQKLDGLLTDANRMAKTIQTIRFVHPDKFAFHEQNSKLPGQQLLEFTQEDLKEAFQTVDTAVATLTAFVQRVKGRVSQSVRERALAFARKLSATEEDAARFREEMRRLLEGRSIRRVFFGPHKNAAPFNDHNFLTRSTLLKRLERAGVDPIFLARGTDAMVRDAMAQGKAAEADAEIDEEDAHPVRVKGVKVEFPPSLMSSTSKATAPDHDVDDVATAGPLVVEKEKNALQRARVLVHIQEDAASMTHLKTAIEGSGVDVWLDIADVNFAKETTEVAVRQLVDMLAGLISPTAKNLQLIGVGSQALMNVMVSTSCLDGGALKDDTGRQGTATPSAPEAVNDVSVVGGGGAESSGSQADGERPLAIVPLGKQQIVELQESAEREKWETVKNDEDGLKKGSRFRLTEDDAKFRALYQTVGSRIRPYQGQECKVTGWTKRPRSNIPVFKFVCRHAKDGRTDEFAFDDMDKVNALLRAVTPLVDDPPAPRMQEAIIGYP